MPAVSATAIKTAAVMSATVKAFMMAAGTGIVMMAVMGWLRLVGIGIVAAKKPEAAAEWHRHQTMNLSRSLNGG
jgi:hypothetical protein